MEKSLERKQNAERSRLERLYQAEHRSSAQIHYLTLSLSFHCHPDTYSLRTLSMLRLVIYSHPILWRNAIFHKLDKTNKNCLLDQLFYHNMVMIWKSRFWSHFYQHHHCYNAKGPRNVCLFVCFTILDLWFGYVTAVRHEF